MRSIITISIIASIACFWIPTCNIRALISKTATLRSTTRNSPRSGTLPPSCCSGPASRFSTSEDLDLAQNKVSVVGINLSDEQVRIAQQQTAAEGFSCEFRIQDYRKVAEKFDRIVSVGMFEHVGKRYYDAFFRKCYDLLTDDGIMLLHTIGRWNGPSDTNAWVWRYILPRGYTPALSELAPAIERSGLITSDIEVLRIHYAETLRAWRNNFLAKRKEVIRLFEEDPILKTRFGSADRSFGCGNIIVPGSRFHSGPADSRYFKSS